jgi:hypothetical protein
MTSAPTPKPLNMGKQYNKYYSKVLTLMQNYHAQLGMEKNHGDNNTKNDNNDKDDKAISTPIQLITDKQINSSVEGESGC